MLKFVETMVTFSEIPNEVTLCINISNCPHNCEECFEPWLRTDTGTPLTLTTLQELIDTTPYITCVCFMGGDVNHQNIIDLCVQSRNNNPNLKFAMYSGDDTIDLNLAFALDYYKIGHYDKKLGPLKSKTTNQRFYCRTLNRLEDVTYLFQKEYDTIY